MYNQIKFDRVFYFLSVIAITFVACKKEESLSDSSPESASDYIAVAAETGTSSGTVADSVYLVQPCAKGSSRDTIAQSALSATITTYLQNNYPGYTFGRAFEIEDRQDNTTGYVVVVYYNEKPVGVEFDASGTFVKTLEQREKGDLQGKGWHHGGRFGDRNGLHKDSIALSALPASILSYMATNHATDTLQKALLNRDSSVLVLSTNNGLYATVFSKTGVFVKRGQLPNKAGRCKGIEQSALPAGALAYLESTYPNYVFKKAFSVSSGSAIQGYVVVIDANNTKYAVEFNSTGSFVNVKTIW